MGLSEERPFCFSKGGVYLEERKCSALQERCVHQYGIFAKIRVNNNQAPPSDEQLAEKQRGILLILVRMIILQEALYIKE